MNSERVKAIVKAALEEAIAADRIRRAVAKAKEEGRDFVSCADCEGQPGFDGCCGSCHEDEDYDCGAYGLFDTESDPRFEGLSTHFCCKVKAWITNDNFGRSGPS
jgi:hypothetical protein